MGEERVADVERGGVPSVCVNVSGHFGDLFQILFLGSFLKKHFPGCRVGWVVRERAYAHTLKYVLGVDDIFVEDRHVPIGKQVARAPEVFAKYQYVFTPNCSSLQRAKFGRKAFKNAVHIGANPRCMNRKLEGYLLRRYYDRLYDFNAYLDPYRVQLISGLNQTLGCHIKFGELLHKDPIYALPETFFKEMRPYLKPDKKNIVLAPGSSDPVKNFPEEGYIQLIQTTKDDYHYIVIHGSEKEEETARRIGAATGATVLSRRYSIHHLAALMSMAHMVVGGDTGPVHLAWAQNTKVVALFRKTRIRKFVDYFYRLGIYDPYMLPLLGCFSHTIAFLPDVVRSWEKGRDEVVEGQKLPYPHAHDAP